MADHWDKSRYAYMTEQIDSIYADSVADHNEQMVEQARAEYIAGAIDVDDLERAIEYWLGRES